MPNTPAIVNQGCSVFVRGCQATQNDADTTHSLLQSIGTSEEITEDMMDAVTALSGSGPAYVFVMIEALADGAVKMGLCRFEITEKVYFTIILTKPNGILFRFTT